MRLIDADAAIQEIDDNIYWTDSEKAAIRNKIYRTPTIDPESLRPEAEWEDGVCTACQFDLRVLTDGENGLKHWVWDEGFDYCPQCGAKLKGAGEHAAD